MARQIPCPMCANDLQETAELTLVDWVHAEHDPERKVRIDLILECDHCGVQLNAFVPLEDFQEVGS